MKQINNGFLECYYLTEKGEVYNAATETYLKHSNYVYNLKTTAGEYKKISTKKLYKLVYDKIFCIDDIEDLDGEIWKPVDRTNGNYMVSNLARVKSLKGNKAIILKENIVKGYSQVMIYYGESRCGKQVSRLVAAAFLPPMPAIDSQIHHISGLSTENRAENLMWVSPEEHRAIHSRKAVNNGETS